MENKITFTNVNKSFYSLKEETVVLNQISFDVKKGEIVAIVGPSGCGKSTLLNLISGLIQPDSGKIEINGKVGYMFQKDHLFEWRTVYKNITLGPEIAKIKIEPEKIDQILKKYGLYDFKNHYPKELSGGMRQRVALLRTLALDPDILLLDEPFSSLDYQTKITVQDDIYKIIKDAQKTTLLVTHDITEAIAMADRVIVLTKRPSTIKAIYDIELDLKEEKTPLLSRNSPKFKEYFNLIWEALDIHE
ncbi:MAG TPA: ABC transporter ATP-binding protein [Candidatus Caccosoma faecigallinarum]|uniref:ABC transporter ATP-binding protein n=1 Tax=Candidatus Caccosoma faecigallinarum TaxID=2840720 RepID=A0A9D1G7C5_9FIRM|nr:aBC transporter ATP-binding protein [Firmicutes bacterium CAG:631]HIT17041.1 ABC transporter ATP-binding protein [Candidatus Caccosoma faecigallinarum]